MAASSGRDGSFRVGSTEVTFIDSWNLGRGLGTEETTYFGEEWESHVATVKNWNASITGTLDRSDSQQAALLEQLEDGTLALQNVRFYTGSSTFWEGSAWVESDSIDNSAKGKVNYSATLKGSGALTHTG